MTHWHELPKNTRGWLIPAKPGSRVAICFRGEDVRNAPFQGHFLRYEGVGEVPKGLSSWKRNPEGWFELWPHEPLFASSIEESKAVCAPLLSYVEEGISDSLFDSRPYQPPAKPQLVKEVEHDTHRASARIVQYPDGVYEVGYAVYAPSGRYFPAATPGISAELNFDWGKTYATDDAGQQLRTLADDLESAQEIALIELDRFVEQDPEIKLRTEL